MRVKQRIALFAGQSAAVLVLFALGRAALLSGFAAGVASSAFFQADVRAEVVEQQVRVPEFDRSEQWARESGYIIWEGESRVGRFPPHVEQHPHPSFAGPKQIRVLAVGDSFTWAHGEHDLDVRWQVELEQELNRRTSPGTFRVDYAASPGTGPLAWLDWLREGWVTPEKYDAVVLAIVWNDAVLTGGEMLLCPTQDCPPLYLEETDVMERCLAASDGLAGRLTRTIARMDASSGLALRDIRCSEAAVSARTGLVGMRFAAANPHLTPYWDSYRSGLRLLREEFGDRIVAAFPAALGPVELAWVLELKPAMEDAGFEWFGPDASVGLIEDGGIEGMFANPGVQHPGPAFTRLYARDAADFLLSRIEPSRLADAAASGGSSAGRNLVSNSMPDAMVLRHDRDAAEVGYRRDAGGDGYVHAGTAGALPAQFVPCMNIGRPHLMLMLRRDLPEGSVLKLSLPYGPPSEVLVLGYSKEGTPSIRKAGKVSQGADLEVGMGGELARGLLIAPDGPEGCSVSSVLDVPDMSLSLEVMVGR